MTTFAPHHLAAIAAEQDLFVAPFRDDGTTYGTPTQVWALIVDEKVYVRAANGTASRWYQAAIRQGAGRIHIAGEVLEARFDAAGTADEDAIDAAYEEKYPGSSAVPIMQGTGPKAAAVLISPR